MATNILPLFLFSFSSYMIRQVGTRLPDRLLANETNKRASFVFQS